MCKKVEQEKNIDENAKALSQLLTLQINNAPLACHASFSF